MESWIVVGIQIALSLITAVAALVAVRWARLSAQEGTEARKLVQALIEAFRKGHGYPSAAAVVTVPKPAPNPEREPEPEPAPAAMRGTLLPAAPPSSASPSTPLPEQANLLFVEKPADRPSHVEIRERGELVGVEVPRSSEERSIPLERQAEYTVEELAAADAYAAEKGITRERALWELIQTGAAKLRAPRESGEHPTKRRSTPTP